MVNAVLVPAPAGDLRPVPAGFMLLCCFAVSLFASASLLFSVQPLVSRLVLPRLGGSPAVWNTCICFFQAALLLGYLYAHIVSTCLRGGFHNSRASFPATRSMQAVCSRA